MPVCLHAKNIVDCFHLEPQIYHDGYLVFLNRLYDGKRSSVSRCVCCSHSTIKPHKQNAMKKKKIKEKRMMKGISEYPNNAHIKPFVLIQSSSHIHVIYYNYEHLLQFWGRHTNRLAHSCTRYILIKQNREIYYIFGFSFHFQNNISLVSKGNNSSHGVLMVGHGRWKALVKWQKIYCYVY